MSHILLNHLSRAQDTDMVEIFGSFLVVFGLLIIAGAVRLVFGSRDAYAHGQAVSKDFYSTMLGDLEQPNGKGGTAYSRGIAYSVGKDGVTTHIAQAKLNRETLEDTSI